MNMLISYIVGDIAMCNVDITSKKGKIHNEFPI